MNSRGVSASRSVWLIVAAAILCAAPASDGRAGVEDSRFTISSDGASVDFELRGVARREVMERLFAGQAIKLEWLNRDVADEAISGNFSGARAEVVRQLLQQTNFVLTYTTVGDARQVARVLVLGRASEGKPVVAAASSANVVAQQLSNTGRQQANGAPTPGAGGAAPMPMPGKTADLKPIARGGGAAPAPPLPGANTSQFAVPMPTSAGSAPMPMPMPTRK